MTASNSNQTRQDLARLRGRGEDPPTVAGYEGPSGQPLPTKGDDDAPHVKTPPFPEEPQLWLEPTELPFGSYLATPAVDVEDYRLLKVYFELSWSEDDHCQLSVLHESRALSQFSGGLEWYVNGVVDPAVTEITPAGQGDGYGSRSFAPSELRTYDLEAAGADRVLRFVLTFDVADAVAFRLQLSQLVEGTEAQIALQFQRSN